MTDRIVRRESSAGSIPSNVDLDLSSIQQKISALEKEIKTQQNEINQQGHLLDFYMLAPSSESSLFINFDPWVVAQRNALLQKSRELKQLEEAKTKLQENLKTAASHLTEEIQKTREELPSFIVDGRIGSVQAALQQFDAAKKHFERAAEEAQSHDLDLEAVDLRFQGILASAEEGENWEADAKRLEEFFQEANREVWLRDESPEDFVTWLESRGDLESWRLLRAEALGAFIELHWKHCSGFENSPLGPASQNLTQYLKEAAHKKISEEELLALLDGLRVVQDARVTQAYELGADAKLDALEKISREMQETLQFATQAAVHYPNNKEMQETLGVLRGLTYFHFWQQAGLPTRAVFSFWENRDPHPAPAEGKLTALIHEKAPHFFDTQGRLLPKEKILPLKEADQAAVAEESLHRDDGPFLEMAAISTGTTMAGAGTLAKAGAVGGIWCGPWAEVCSPLGAIVGGIAGYFGGEKILNLLHASEREPFVNDVALAGFSLSRITREEATINDAIHDAMQVAVLAMIGMSAQPLARGSSKMARMLQWTTRPETWRYFGRQMQHESRYALRWFRALQAGTRGFFGVAPKVEGSFPSYAPSFEEVWQRLAPWQQEKGHAYWSNLWEQMQGRTLTPTPPPPPSRALIDRVLGPVNLAWDKTFGRVTQFGSNRLKAIRAAVFENHPEFSYSVNPLIGRKELMRASVLADAGLPVNGNGNGAARWPAFENFAKWMNQNVGTPEFERAHRWGLPFAAAGLFHDADGDEGGGWGWDGEWDSAWEFLPFFLWTNAAGKPLFDNSVLGADIAGAINLFTIDRMLAISNQEGSPDFDRYRGAHYHYLVATVANSVFLSGLHYMKRFPLGQLAGSVPFARTLPSMTSFPTAFRPRSTFDKPNFATAAGLLLTLGYQSYLTGYQVSDIFSHRKLVNTDPYYTWQRGTKYAVVVPAVNALQAALGYRSALGQTAGRLLGLPPDIGLAMVDPPFLNKGTYATKEKRLLDAGDEKSLEGAWDVFVDANTSLDLGGVLGRVWDENGGGYLGWKPLRVGHWRWERRGIETWTSPTPLKSLDGRKGFIEQLAESKDPKDRKKLDALTQMYYHQFVDPKAPWRKSTSEQHGMMIFAFMTKYFAEKDEEGEKDFQTFRNLTHRPELASFFKNVPTPKSHADLLDYVRQVDEGEFLWIMQKAPDGAPEGEETFPTVIVLRQPTAGEINIRETDPN